MGSPALRSLACDESPGARGVRRRTEWLFTQGPVHRVLRQRSDGRNAGPMSLPRPHSLSAEPAAPRGPRQYGRIAESRVPLLDHRIVEFPGDCPATRRSAACSRNTCCGSCRLRCCRKRSGRTGTSVRSASQARSGGPASCTILRRTFSCRRSRWTEAFSGPRRFERRARTTGR